MAPLRFYMGYRFPCTLVASSWALEECQGHSNHGVSENIKMVNQEGERMSLPVLWAHSTIVMRVGSENDPNCRLSSFNLRIYQRLGVLQ